MKFIYQIALAVHIISGMSALVAGLFAIISKKGKNVHLKAGIIFFYSMLLVVISAIYISILKNNAFLLHIAIFSFFMVFSGYRSIKNKSLKPNFLDWIVLLTALTNSVWMLFSFKIVLMVFGLLGCLLALSDLRIFNHAIQKREIPKNQWLLRHIGMMLGAYISTATAFIVVNISMTSYPWIPWLLPSIIGTPLIIYWTKKYSANKKVPI